MPKTEQQWYLFRYVKREIVPLSKPFKTRKEAEQARERYPERERKGIALGFVRTK